MEANIVMGIAVVVLVIIGVYLVKLLIESFKSDDKFIDKILVISCIVTLIVVVAELVLRILKDLGVYEKII